MTTHTPTPWRQSRQGHDILHDGKGEKVLVGICTDPNNAAFIVRACNAHELLIREFQNLLETAIMRGNLKEGEDLVRSARHALAKAKGEA